MLRKLLLSSVLVLLPVLAVVPAAAQEFDPLKETCEETPEATICKEITAQDNLNDDPLTGAGGTLNTVSNLIAIVTGIVAVIIIIVAGITMTLSSGDSTKIQNSRNAIIYAVVGLIVVALARALIVFVLNRL